MVSLVKMESQEVRETLAHLETLVQLDPQDKEQ